ANGINVRVAGAVEAAAGKYSGGGRRLEMGAAFGDDDATGSGVDGRRTSDDGGRKHGSWDPASSAREAGIHGRGAPPGFGFESGGGSGNGVCLRPETGRKRAADSCRADEL